MTEEDTFEALLLRIEIDGGIKRYYNNENQLHRKYGPAVIYASGNKFWFINGERHRTDGPAVIYANSSKYWYIHDKQLTKAEFLKHPLCTIIGI